MNSDLNLTSAFIIFKATTGGILDCYELEDFWISIGSDGSNKIQLGTDAPRLGAKSLLEYEDRQGLLTITAVSISTDVSSTGEWIIPHSIGTIPCVYDVATHTV